MFVILGSFLVAAAVAPSFRRMHAADLIVNGPGVTRVVSLSDYFRTLSGSPADTPVYILEGTSPGGTMLVVAGTHADETAGYLAAVVLIERARLQQGRVIIVPRANASGFSHNVPQEAHPQFLEIRTALGLRRFAYGARATNPIHQWPDPQIYTPPHSGQTLSGQETRNLNRAYPGRPDGSLTEQIAYAILSLIRTERVDLALDLHEASPEYPVVNTIVAHDRAMDLAALVNLNLQALGIEIGLEKSPENLRGLSHREWGDNTQALSVLMETTNPAQGRLRGRTSADLVVLGMDRFYAVASARHKLSVPFPESGWPLTIRVARHLAGIMEFSKNLGDFLPGRSLEIKGIPEYQEFAGKGIEAFLR
jgi:hypothetical protein